MSRKMRLRGVCAVAVASVVMLVGANTAFALAYTEGTKPCSIKQVGGIEFSATLSGTYMPPGSKHVRRFVHANLPQIREDNSERQGGGAWYVSTSDGLIQWVTPSCINGLL